MVANVGRQFRMKSKEVKNFSKSALK